VNEKIACIASKVFSIDRNRIKIDSTNTSRVANTSPTAASSGADLNGFATQKACEIIFERLKKKAADDLKLSNSSGIELIDEHIFYNGKQTDIT
jgi:xanthine dehydrogenase large subunit